jgi:hypothetical protein
MVRRAVTILKKKKEIKANNLVLSRKREATPHHAQPKLCPRSLPLPPLTVPEQLIANEEKGEFF